MNASPMFNTITRNLISFMACAIAFLLEIVLTFQERIAQDGYTLNQPERQPSHSTNSPDNESTAQPSMSTLPRRRTSTPT